MKGLRADLQLEEEILFGLRPAPPEAELDEPSVVQVAPGLHGLSEYAQRVPGKSLEALFHYIDVDLLKAAYSWLEQEGMRGSGGNTWKAFGQNLHGNIVKLYVRLQQGSHRTLPPWRRVAALAQGQRRLLKRAALKDRIVQRAVAAVLAQIYAAEFAGVLRDAEPTHDPHDALKSFAA